MRNKKHTRTGLIVGSNKSSTIKDRPVGVLRFLWTDAKKKIEKIFQQALPRSSNRRFFFLSVPHSSSSFARPFQCIRTNTPIYVSLCLVVDDDGADGDVAQADEVAGLRGEGIKLDLATAQKMRLRTAAGWMKRFPCSPPASTVCVPGTN